MIDDGLMTGAVFVRSSSDALLGVGVLALTCVDNMFDLEADVGKGMLPSLLVGTPASVLKFEDTCGGVIVLPMGTTVVVAVV